MKMNDVLIIGGGLAGLINALCLSRTGWNVVLVEKNTYPFHRVCGEYISNEARPFLKKIGCYPEELHPVQIRRFSLSSVSGNQIDLPLDLGGFGISRYRFDQWIADKVRKSKVRLVEGTSVIKHEFTDGKHLINLSSGEKITSRLVIGCHGKRSTFDKILNRPFMNKRSPYVGIKQHVSMNFPDDLIALHNFDGGYLGLSKVEDDKVNIAYLCKREKLRQAGSIKALEQNLLSKNPHIRQIFTESQPLFDHPLVINEIAFEAKEPVNDHILMSGDAAGMITPLCGNGMAMAIHSAKLLSFLSDKYLSNQINRSSLENRYIAEWRQTFAQRIVLGRRLQRLFGNYIAPELTIRACRMLPALGIRLVRLSHGQEF